MKKKAIARIIEALVSSILIITAFSLSYYLLTPPSAAHIRSAEDLTKYGYNLLSALATNDGFEKLLFNSNGVLKSDWAQDLKVVINSLVPSNVIFNINVYNSISNSDGLVDLVKLNGDVISNAMIDNSKVNEDAFLKAGESAEISYIYSSHAMWILVFELQLADLGGS